MKKLSLLIALALLITVGGVYATWSYAESTATASSTIAPQVKLTATSNTTKGTITFVGAPAVAFDDDNKDHTAELNWNDTQGNNTSVVKVVFTPAQGTTSTKIDVLVTINLPTSKFTASNVEYLVFEPANNVATVYPGSTVDTATNTITVKITDVGDGGFELDLSKCITTNLRLPTLTDYTNFQHAMSGYPISISAAEATNQP